MKRVILAIVGVVVIVAGAGAWLLVQHELSRSSSPTPVATASPDQMEVRLQQLSLRDKVASLFMFHAPGVDVMTLTQFVDTYQPGGMIMMGDNIPTDGAAVAAVSAALRGTDRLFPRLVAIDQEGGVVRRLTGDTYASALTLRDAPVAVTADAFSARSRLVQAAGATVNFGIIADVTADPHSFIYDRVLSTTPQAAGQRVAAAVRATTGKTLSTLKHFPGHGETEADSHTSVPTTNVSLVDWQLRDQPPFQAGIDAGADIVMMGHLRYPAVDTQPASLSKKWHQLLRNQMHFTGVIVTDDMVMLQDSGEPAYADPVANAVAALQAGSTMLLYVLDNADSPPSMIDPNALINGVVAAVHDGRMSMGVIDQAASQLLRVRHQAAALQ